MAELPHPPGQPLPAEAATDVTPADTALPDDRLPEGETPPEGGHSAGPAADHPGETSRNETAEAPESPETREPPQKPELPEHPQRDEGDADSAPLREELARRIRGAERLPRGLRDRLAEAAAGAAFTASGEEEASLRLSDVIALFEESIPPQMTLAPDRVQRATHPSGETFFTGEVGELSDEEAGRIAAEQLRRAGLGGRRDAPHEPHRAEAPQTD